MVYICRGEQESSRGRAWLDPFVLKFLRLAGDICAPGGNIHTASLAQQALSTGNQQEADALEVDLRAAS